VTTDAANRWPHLARLFGAYANQDWDAYGKAPEDAVRRFAAEVEPEAVAGARREIRDLLGAVPDEAGLDRTLDALGCGYAPAADGTSTRAWLARVARLLRVRRRGRGDPGPGPRVRSS
jgi:hypothetical protein